MNGNGNGIGNGDGNGDGNGMIKYVESKTYACMSACLLVCASL